MGNKSYPYSKCEPRWGKLARALLLSTVLLLGLPLLGAVLSGHSALAYLEFPPLTRHVQHAQFSWAVFIALSVVELALVGRVVTWCFSRTPYRTRQRTTYPFPWWGWIALLSLPLFWILAWAHFDWSRPFHAWIFVLLWLSYIFTMDALTYRRSGTCLLTHGTPYFVALFPVSAGFWWYFEYLNRFVENWYYIGVCEFTSSQYVMHATSAFATVLPAVMSTMELMKSFPWVTRRNSHSHDPMTISRFNAIVILLLSCLGLMGVSVWPDYLFPLIWIVPILILESLICLFGMEGPFMKIWNRQRDLLGLAMLSALICGFFWEMWNFYSSPKWVYSIPYVHRFMIFEMPVLGYLGYLPFGVECLVVADLVKRAFAESRDLPKPSR